MAWPVKKRDTLQKTHRAAFGEILTTMITSDWLSFFASGIIIFSYLFFVIDYCTIFCASGIFIFLMPLILRSNNWDWQNYPKTRFASEYGFQAFPAFSVLEPVNFFPQNLWWDVKTTFHDLLQPLLYWIELDSWIR